MPEKEKKYVARVQLMDDGTKQGYYFNLYSTTKPEVYDTMYAVVNACNIFKVGRVVEIIDVTESPIEPKKDVVALIDIAEYEQRCIARKREQELMKRKREICAELDNILLGKKDVAYYRHMAQVLELTDEQKQLIDELLLIELETKGRCNV